MAANLQQRIEIIKSKATLLAERYAEIVEQKRAAEAKIDELQEQIHKQKSEMNRMTQEIEHLKVVTTLTPKREDVEQSRAFLSQLIRDIDKCIAEMTE